MGKHFIITPNQIPVSKKAINESRREQEGLLRSNSDVLTKKGEEKLQEEDNLIHVEGRIVVKVDMELKNFHRFEGGITIRRERAFNEFNRRITQPVNCIVISGEGIPKGAEMLVEHNALHETNRINDYKNTFEQEDSDRIRYFSVELYECYAWRMDAGDWQSIPPFDFGLRLFKPYEGAIMGIEPEQLKDVLYVTSGELKGNVVKTLVSCDYEIIYQDVDGREGHLVCFRPFGDSKRGLDEEAIAILHDETGNVNNGKLLIGYSLKDAKTLKEFANA